MLRRPERSADEILAIDAEGAAALFPGDEVAGEREFRRLIKEWHPDHCQEPKATEVTAHLIGLRRFLAVRRGGEREDARRGSAVSWLAPLCIPDPTSRTLADVDGRFRTFRVRLERPFELGTMLVGDAFVLFCVRPDCDDLFRSARETIVSFRYADARMEREMSRHLPVLVECFQTAQGDHAMVLAKGADDLPMAEVCRVFDAQVDPRHVAWMMSSLHHLACYLTYAGLSHNAISPDTCFISPRRHAVTLLGGWWYSTRRGEPLRALPDWSLRNLPREVFDGRRVDPRADLSLIRAVGRCLLGSEGLGRAPVAMRRFLESAVSGDALSAYREWGEQVLPKSFGARRFVNLPVESDQVYDTR